METATIANLDKICRTCLLESPRMVSLTSKMEDGSRTINDMLLFVLNDKVIGSSRFPQQICRDCESLLCKLDEFKRRCVDADRVLMELLNAPELGPLQNVKLELPSKMEKSRVLENYYELNPANLMLSIKEDESAVDSFDGNKDFKVIDVIKEEFSNEFSDGMDSFDDNDLMFDNKESFSCSCGKAFTNSNEYDKHLAMKSCGRSSSNDLLSIPVKCEECNIVFKNTRAFKVHARSHSSKRECFPCTFCKRKFKKKTSLQVHLDNKTCRKELKSKVKEEISQKEKTLLMPVKCGPCDTVFTTMALFKKHSCVHEKETQEYYQCSLCTRKFKKKKSLVTHLKNHEERDNVKYTCNTCKREFKYQAHLDNHIIAEHTSKKELKLLQIYPIEEQLNAEQTDKNAEKKHSCKLCSKSFTILSTLTDHMRTHTGERPFLCSVCGRGFTQKTNLGQHMRRHLGLKPFKCGECERRFVSKGELDAHTRKHSGAHPFVCGECGNGFTTASSLKKHKRVHSGERPYACDLCPMKFAVSGTLKCHRRTHTGEKPYQCSYCEKAFVQRQDLVAHIRCHTGERPFVCAHCGQAFRKPSALKVHMKTHKMPAQPAPQPMLGALQPLSLLQGLNTTS